MKDAFPAVLQQSDAALANSDAVYSSELNGRADLAETRTRVFRGLHGEYFSRFSARLLFIGQLWHDGPYRNRICHCFRSRSVQRARLFAAAGHHVREQPDTFSYTRHLHRNISLLLGGVGVDGSWRLGAGAAVLNLTGRISADRQYDGVYQIGPKLERSADPQRIAGYWDPGPIRNSTDVPAHRGQCEGHRGRDRGPVKFRPADADVDPLRGAARDHQI